MASGYLLGVGSNIVPDQHIPQIIEALLDVFLCVHVSRVVWVPPIGMQSNAPFLNLVVYVETRLTAAALKKQLNQIEISLGRDRAAIDSKTTDRTADIDILQAFTPATAKQAQPAMVTDEYFLYPLLAELFACLAQQAVPEVLQKGVAMSAAGSAFGEAATAIYRETYAGDKRVV